MIKLIDLKKIIFVIVFIQVQIYMYGQDIKQELSNITFASPDVASLGKFVEAPVSIYTGIPNIAIPLETLKDNKLSINLLLSYNASGFKVSDEATSVGLGWNLKAGGVVIKLVRGEIDYKIRDTIPSFYNINRSYLDNLITSKAADNQPDLYYYNFNGFTGQFLLSDSGRAINKDKNNFVINPIYKPNNEIAGFKFTTTKGIVYSFGVNGNIVTNINQLSIGDQLTGSFEPQLYENSSFAYYLSKIESENGIDSISFKYKNEDYSYYTNTFRTQDYSISGQQGGSSSLAYNRVWISSKRIESISSKSWAVKFIYIKNREDLPNNSLDTPMCLAEYDLYDCNNILTKRVKFFTSYFISRGIENATEEEIHNFKRLKLDSVSIFTANKNNHLPPYIFKYDTMMLPNKKSFAQDMWGFYNGQFGNNVFMLPNVKNYYFLPVGQDNPVIIDIIGGSDREPNKSFMKACILSEIEYPTGGIHKYSFESNIFSKRIYKLVNKNSVVAAGVSGYETSELNYSKSDSIFIPKGYQLVRAYFEFRRAKAYKNNTSHGSFGVNDYGGSIDLDEPGIKYYYKELPLSLFNINNINILDVSGFHGHASLSLILRAIDSSFENTIAGGLRIKQLKIINTGGDSLVKNYDYTIHDTASFSTKNISSGSIVSQPINVSTYLKSLGTSVKKQLLTLCSSSLIGLGQTQGGYVGYSEVKVFEHGGSNGSSIYYFSSPKGFPYKYSAHWGSFDLIPEELGEHNYNGDPYFLLESGIRMTEPYIPPASNNYLTGLLLKKIKLDRNNQIISTDEYGYSFLQSEMVEGIKAVSKYGSVIILGDSYYQPVRINFNIYTNYIGCSILNSHNSIFYPSMGSPNYIMKKKTYSYYDKIILLKEKVESLNDGISKKTVYKYPFNYDMGVYPEMADKNIISPIVEEKISLIKNEGEFPLMSNKVNFAKSQDGIYVAKSIDFQKGIAPMQVQLKFNLYDLHANILEQQKANNVKEAYLWGYKSQYPVAKIIGSGFDEVMMHTDTSILNNGTENQIEAQLTALRNYYKNNPSVQVYTYTYAPLIGMTSKTDAKGNTTYYDYDSFGRLKDVKDKDGNILKRYDYHYSNQ